MTLFYIFRSTRSLLNLTGSSGAPSGNGFTGKPDFSDPAKFLSDGISQLTMGSFQVPILQKSLITDK